MVAAILNFNSGDVIVKHVPKGLEHLEAHEIIAEMGYKEEDVSYMFADDSMDVFVHTESLSQVTTLK